MRNINGALCYFMLANLYYWNMGLHDHTSTSALICFMSSVILLAVGAAQPCLVTKPLGNHNHNKISNKLQRNTRWNIFMTIEKGWGFDFPQIQHWHVWSLMLIWYSLLIFFMSNFKDVFICKLMIIALLLHFLCDFYVCESHSHLLMRHYSQIVFLINPRRIMNINLHTWAAIFTLLEKSTKLLVL